MVKWSVHEKYLASWQVLNKCYLRSIQRGNCRCLACPSIPQPIHCACYTNAAFLSSGFQPNCPTKLLICKSWGFHSYCSINSINPKAL